MNTRHDGFTAMELVIVMAAIAILFTIAYPSYKSAIRKTKRAEGRAALMRALQQEERYYSKHMTYVEFSSASTTPDEKLFAWHSSEEPKKSAYEIRASDCTNESIRDCVMVMAMPGTDKVDSGFTDTACGELAMTSLGDISASGEEENCWQ